jgi:hypothetical protein
MASPTFNSKGILYFIQYFIQQQMSPGSSPLQLREVAIRFSGL